MDNSLPNNGELLFPPGYRFIPTDQELINEYLKPKTNNQPFHQKDMHEVDVYKQNPTELTALHKAKGDGVWYFFTRRNKKYPNGKRPSRTAGDGYWRASSKDKEIEDDEQSNQVIGYRMSLSFMKGDKSNKIKTSWIMKEFRLPKNTTNNIAATVTAPRKRSRNSPSMLDGWVLCKIYRTAQPDEETAMRQDQQLQTSQPPLVPLTTSTTQPYANDHHGETSLHQSQQHPIYTLLQVPPSASRMQPNDNDNGGQFGLLSNNELHAQDDDDAIWKDLVDIQPLDKMLPQDPK